jgi:hypothetical protein
MSAKKQTRKVGVAGGFFNQLMGNNSTEPKVGEGATILMYSDREPYEVTWVSEDGRQCKIRPMDAKFIGSSYGDERYELSSNEKAGETLLEWNDRRKCWGSISHSIQIIKSLQNKLIKEYGWGWSDYLPVPKEEIIIKDDECPFVKYKLVKGVTKKYKNFNKLSIIFGTAEKYRDPHF